MILQNWILPILIGVISAVLLLAILFNNKQRFADLGALIQLENSQPNYYGLQWLPLNYSSVIPPKASQGQISGSESPLWIKSIDGSVNYPVYNYYPKALLNPRVDITGTSPQVVESYKKTY